MENKKVTAYLSCEKFVDNIFELLKERYKAAAYKDVIVIDIDKDEQIVLFKYGVIVCWDVGYENSKYFKDFLKEYEINSFKKSIVEEFEYVSSKDYRIQQDTIYLDTESTFTNIAISYAISQTLKLEYFEKEVQKSIDDNSAIANQLAQSGKIKLHKKDLSKKIGELFLVKSSLNLHYDLLDTPDFFWEYSEYESYYERMIKYLDLKARVEVLNKKLEVIQELFDMLKGEQNHKYSSLLEWIIIVLIAFEIVMNIAEHII